MADNPFITGLNQADVDFGKVANEQFEVIRTGVAGLYTALSIDDLTTGTDVIPGGLGSINTVVVYVSRQTFLNGQFIDGTVLKVRGKNVRVNSIGDDADDAILLTCGPATATIRQ